MKKYCFGCKQQYRLKELTEDHIIPQAIGGKLEIGLCQTCHDKINKIDTSLVEQLKKIATLLDIKRERKENRKFRVRQVETGKEFYIDSKNGHRARPEIDISFDQDGLVKPAIKARSEKELSRIIKNIESRYGQFSPGFKTTIESMNIGKVEYENTIGERLFIRSVAKSAYLFLARSLPDNWVLDDIFNPVRNFIFEDQGEILAYFNYIHTKFMIDHWRPVHGIGIHFDSKRRNIVGFVQYFGIYRFSVLLAGPYTWKIIGSDLKYTFDPVIGKEVPLNSRFMLPDLTINEILYPYQTTKLIYEEITNGYLKFEKYFDLIKNTKIKFFDNLD